MQYLFGDSTASDLEFDYLAFTREVIDCAVVMAECEVTLAVTVEDRRTRELETAAVVAAVEELGKRASQVVGPVTKDQASTPIGRCAAAITMAIREAVDKESLQVRAALAAERDEMDKQDQRQRERARDVLGKLLRTHDLPGADKEFEVAWTATGVKATLRQRTGFGVEAMLSLEIPPSSVLGLDLRVDRIAENVEVHAHEIGGWLKKSDKLVAHKLGRYHVANVLVGSEATTVRLRMTPEANAVGFVVTARRTGELTIEPTGGGPNREVAVDERGRPALRLLADRLEAAVRALAETRTGTASVEIDGKPLAQHEHPQVLAERLIAAIAPTVQNIARHSRSPGELVLRRLIGENRREEIFVSTAELLKRLDGLPSHARELFAPLQLGGEPARPPADEPTSQARPVVEGKPASPAAASGLAPAPGPVPAPAERAVPVADRKGDAEPEPRATARPVANRTAPPPLGMPDVRSGPTRLSSTIPAVEARRVTSPTSLRGELPVIDPPLFDDKEPSVSAKPQPSPEVNRKREDDLALSEAIERALDEEEGVSSPK
ncbi:MAG TPA: hypothetical protein VHN14_10565 [Kofleriaceae bacterium]|nr:hypothetical protein [Kofleriaceae bacterium]